MYTLLRGRGYAFKSAGHFFYCVHRFLLYACYLWLINYRKAKLMIEHVQLLRNIGKFASVSPGAQVPFSKVTLIYAENGRGKTTLAAVLRSLRDGDPCPIRERHRLSTSKPPHVVIDVGSTSPLIFQNYAWSATLPDITIFDDTFVAQNVCSGIDIQTEHRQNLHELILGAQGVALNKAVQTYVEQIEEHNRTLRIRADAIPAAHRGSLGVDAFCELEPHLNIDDAIKHAEQSLAAAKSADKVHTAALFSSISLPPFDVSVIDALLKRDLPALDERAANSVQAHFDQLGEGAEDWVSEGMFRVSAKTDTCPFCSQDLQKSPVIAHYRAYFSEEYSKLKRDIDFQLSAVERAHGGDNPAAFERSIRLAEQGCQFWNQFTTVPDVSIDTSMIARAWKTAREAVIMELRKKQAAPLEPATLSKSALKAIDSYHTLRDSVAKASTSLLETNPAIQIVKEKAAGADVSALTADLAKLTAIKVRYSDAVAPLCRAYLDEKKEKEKTERLRDEARASLDPIGSPSSPPTSATSILTSKSLLLGFAYQASHPSIHAEGHLATTA